MTPETTAINTVAAALFDNEIWHRRAAVSAVKLGFRGLARWHEHESRNDFESLASLEKYLADNYPKVDAARQIVGTSAAYVFSDLKTHLGEWDTKVANFANTLGEGISTLLASKYYVLANKLVCYLEEAENEALYVRILRANFEAADFKAHHVLRINEKLHKYFEHEYDGGRIDFTIE
jgi:hypothetical protein